MVKLKSQLESRCVTMQLAFCLVIGLRLVSASLLDSACSLRQQRQSPSTLQEAHDHPDSAPPTRKWSVTMAAVTYYEPMAEAQNKTKLLLPEARKDTKGSAGIKRSVVDSSNECLPSRNSTHHGGNARQHPCTMEVAGDYLNDVRNQPSSDSMLKGEQSQMSESDLVPSSTDSESSSHSSSDVTTASTVRESNKSSGSNSVNGNTLSSPATNNESPLEPRPSSSSLQGPSSLLMGTLPRIDFGAIKDNTPNPTQDSNNNAGMTVSDGNAASQSIQARPSQQRTKAIAAGVTVPIGVIALGLAALLVLHKQRQHKKKMQHLQSGGGKGDEELAEEVTDPPAQPNVSVGEAISTVTHGGEARYGQAEHAPANVQDGEADEVEQPGSEGSSHISHSTAASQSARVPTAANPPVSGPALQVAAAAAAAADAGVESSQKEQKPPPRSPAARSRSLRRKPVPALLESFETAQTIPTLPSVEQEADGDDTSLGLPQTSLASESYLTVNRSRSRSRSPNC